MKTLLIILLLGTTLNSIPRKEKPEIILELKHRKMVVHLWKPDQYSPRGLLEVTCKAQELSRGCGHKSRGMAAMFLDFNDDENTNSQFQNLYNWIKELEKFAFSNSKVGDKMEINIGGRSILIAHKSHIHVDYLSSTECVPEATLNSKNITDFKFRLIEYIKGHNISVTL